MKKDFMWVIDKEFAWEAGHRVWQQQLNNPELSVTTECSCRLLHGHSYKIQVFVGANELDHSSMVTDFKNLNFVKNFVDDQLDHKFIIDINDPNFKLITGVPPLSECDNFTLLISRLGNLDEFPPEERLHLDSFVLVDFCPTSENLCKNIYEFIKDKLKELPHVTVTAVELWETAKSHCRYEE